MHGHTHERLLLTHTQRPQRTRDDLAVTQIPSAHIVYSITDAYPHTHTHTQLMSGVTYISALKPWIYENMVSQLLASRWDWSLCLCVFLCVPPLLYTAAADWDSSSCMIKRSLHTRRHTQTHAHGADVRLTKSDSGKLKVMAVYRLCETRKCPHKRHHGQHTHTRRDHVGVYFAGGSLKMG